MPIDIELEVTPPKLVISSQVIPSSVMIVTISKSFSALSDNDPNETILDQILVDSAIAVIHYSGNTDTLYPVPDIAGVYASLSTPQAVNVAYRLEVYDPGIEEFVYATATMLPQVRFDSVSARIDSSGVIPFIEVYVEFNDLDGDNWYMINFYSEPNDSLQSGSPFLNDYIRTETRLVQDNTFSGVFSGSFKLYEWTDEFLFVSISNISQGYYEYIELRQKSANFFTDLAKEPINYPSNVVNGYGYFNTHFPDTRFVLTR